jgi:hypothetical protein
MKSRNPESSKTSLFALGPPKSCSLHYREFIGAFYSEFWWFVKEIWLKEHDLYLVFNHNFFHRVTCQLKKTVSPSNGKKSRIVEMSYCAENEKL